MMCGRGWWQHINFWVRGVVVTRQIPNLKTRVRFLVRLPIRTFMITYQIVNTQYARNPTPLEHSNSDWNITTLDCGKNWHMWKKPLCLQSRIHTHNLSDDKLVMYCDAFDVKLQATPTNVEQLYCKHFENKVVFNAESEPTNWLNKPKIQYKSHTLGKKFPYINAGVFLGRVKQLKQVLTAWCAAFANAQPFLTAGSSGCDQVPLIMAWNNDPRLPICIDTYAHIMLATRSCKLPIPHKLAIQHDN